MANKQIYEVVIGESVSLARERWLIQAPTLLAAIKKAESKRAKNKPLYRGWVIVSAQRVGELENL